MVTARTPQNGRLDVENAHALVGLTKLIEVATLLPVGWQRPRAVHQGTSLPRILVFKIHKELVVFRL